MRVGLRPEALGLGVKSRDRASGRITFIENLGSELLVHLVVRGLDQKLIAKLDATQLGLVAMDKDVPLDIPLERLLVFDQTGARVRHTTVQYNLERKHG